MRTCCTPNLHVAKSYDLSGTWKLKKGYKPRHVQFKGPRTKLLSLMLVLQGGTLLNLMVQTSGKMFSSLLKDSNILVGSASSPAPARFEQLSDVDLSLHLLIQTWPLYSSSDWLEPCRFHSSGFNLLQSRKGAFSGSMVPWIQVAGMAALSALHALAHSQP
ncbi:hypothetical protein AVEN_40854-1 [Araneus ventricosus]|uniref:Uncharacterized protein n=1 Tax=Araneus ventricosus TaxID=182803 RepID=A0A4Y2SMX0_ARAVE|nr:hypothetical protein AVEN_40854-1 [Araneus ventricosus]